MKILLTAFSFFFFSTTFSQIPTNGLQGLWRFDGNADDASGNNNHGTVYGASLANDRFSQPNKAYCFDGVDDYIKTAFSGIAGTGSRTVSFWAKISSTGNTINSSGHEFFSYGDFPGTASGGSFRLVLNRDCQGMGVNIGSAVEITTNSVVTYDIWHHYAIVYDQSVSGQLNSIDLYLDGVLLPNSYCTTYNVTATLNTQTNEPIHFGRLYLPSDGRFFSGCLDDFYMYNRALSAAEIGILYNDNTASLETINTHLEIKIYPNPVNSILKIETNNLKVARVQVQALDGKVIYDNNFSSSLDLSGLNSGIYVLVLMDENGLILHQSKVTKL